jgi:radical SAM superfamily enzyme YgiQ (UPF0313 family)
MRIILTAPPLHDLGDPGSVGHIRVCPNYGLYLLAAVAEEAGHEARVIDPVYFEKAFGSREAIAATVKDTDALGLSVNSCTWPRARRLLFDLEKIDGRPVTVLGGPHPSLFDEHILESSPADYAVRGEGERPLTALLDRLSNDEGASGIPGVTYGDGGGIARNPMPELLSPDELSSLPLPRFDLMPENYYDLIPVETSRGCLHACVFCSVTYRRSWRGVEPEAAADCISRLSGFLDRTTRKKLFIIDDCFTADHKRLKSISSKLSGFPHPLVFEARIPDVIAEGMIDTIAALPVGVMEMGVECGYDEGLAKIGKKLTLEQVERAAKIIDGRGLSGKSRFSFIMTLPWETKKEVLKTLEYAFKLTGKYGSRLAANWLTVFPGSMIWKKRDQWGIEIEIEDYDRDEWWSGMDMFKRCHPLLNIEKDLEDIAAYAQMMTRLFPHIQHDGWFKYLPQ